MLGDTGFTLVGLCIKGMLAVELFAVSRNLLALGGVVSPDQVPKCQSMKNTEKKMLSIQSWFGQINEKKFRLL